MTTSSSSSMSLPPAWLAHAFRPFFLLAALYAIVVMAGWLGAWFLAWPVTGALAPVHWHTHEMLFGVVVAAIAGFLLTAMCNWTGAAPLAGRGLAAVVGLWLAGRLVMWTSHWLPPAFVGIVDSAFLLVLAGYAGRVILAAGNRRNLILIGVIGVLFLANVFSHLGYWWLDPGWARRGELMAVFLVVLLMVIIGGRITPAFTRNWLLRRGRPAEPVRSHSWVERMVMISTIALVPAVLIPLPAGWLAALVAICGLANLVRVLGWSGWAGRSDPLIWILHVGYGWVVVGLLLKSAGLVIPALPDSAWLHALGVGAMGTLILGVMTRVCLGHTGRELILPAGAWSIYLAITTSAALRVLSAVDLVHGRWPLALAAAAWMLAFALFLVFYSRVLATPRADGRPG